MLLCYTVPAVQWRGCSMFNIGLHIETLMWQKTLFLWKWFLVLL